MKRLTAREYGERALLGPDEGREWHPPSDEQPCSTHDWSPPRLIPGQPRAPLSECPHCRAAQMATRRLTRKHDPEGIDHPRYPHISSYSERVAFALDRYNERQVERGRIVPGSPEEERALQIMDAKRKDELAKLNKPKHWARGTFARVGSRFIRVGD